MVTCESCNAPISDFMQAHSIVPVLQKVDKVAGYSFFQCTSGAASNNAPYQHYCCSEAHMIQVVKNCITNHYNEASLMPRDASQVTLHNTVFNANLLCKSCNAPLTSVAYRFCLTHASPHTLVADNSIDSLGEWCCSLAHAKQSALNIIGAINAKVLV